MASRQQENNELWNKRLAEVAAQRDSLAREVVDHAHRNINGEQMHQAAQWNRQRNEMAQTIRDLFADTERLRQRIAQLEHELAKYRSADAVQYNPVRASKRPSDAAITVEFLDEPLALPPASK